MSAPSVAHHFIEAARRALLERISARETAGFSFAGVSYEDLELQMSDIDSTGRVLQEIRLTSICRYCTKAQVAELIRVATGWAAVDPMMLSGGNRGIPSGAEFGKDGAVILGPPPEAIEIRQETPPAGDPVVAIGEPLPEANDKKECASRPAGWLELP